MNYTPFGPFRLIWLACLGEDGLLKASKNRHMPNRCLTYFTLAPAFAFALALAFAPAPAVRALDWDRTEIEQRADIGRSLPAFVFTCTNSGTGNVTITELHPSCACLAPALDKQTLASGESARLTIGFDRTGYVGETVRFITIMTDELPDGKAYSLRLVADLPEALEFTTRRVFWKQGEKVKAKSIDIKVNMPDGVKITGATSNRDDVTVKLVTLKKGKHYRLDIKPLDTNSSRLAVITLQPAEPLSEDTALTVYAQVR